jgi:hypothetical protein
MAVYILSRIGLLHDSSYSMIFRRIHGNATIASGLAYNGRVVVGQKISVITALASGVMCTSLIIIPP